MIRNIKNYLICTLLFIIVIYILYNNQLIINSIKSSIILWLKIIPSLIPYMLLTSFILKYCNNINFNLISKLFKISNTGAMIYILSLFCGYPTNAKLINDALELKKISLKEASIILTYSNMPNPLFIYNVGLTILEKKYIITILIMMYVSNFIIAVLLRNKEKKLINENTDLKIQGNIIINTFNILILILGIQIVVNIILNICSNLFNLNIIYKTIINGILEFSSGIANLILINELKLRFLLFIIFTFTGGISIIMQIKNILPKNISYYYYYKYRITFTIIQAIMGYMLIRTF